MVRLAGFTISALVFFCPYLRAQSGAEISASRLMEQIPDMLDTVPAPPPVTEAEVVELEEGDPETYIFVHDAQAHPPKPVDLGGDGILSLVRLDTGEQLSARYRGRNGVYDQAGIEKLRGIMHCSLTGKETDISVKLLELLDAVEDRFGKRGLTLLSGYRTPRLNKQVSGAARRSLHMLGWAADIRIPGYSPAAVTAFAKKIRVGGVGYYQNVGFTHLDVGRPRYWIDKSPRGGRNAPGTLKTPRKNK